MDHDYQVYAAEADQRLADLGTVSEWIGFSASCIKSGEPWTATCEKMRDDARAALARLSAPPPPAGSDGWVVPKSLSDMPAKPGLERYEYVECLVLYCGEILTRPWNCEHQVFDDEHQDDFFCEWSDVSAYRSLAGDREAARAALAPTPPVAPRG